jgi:hypothetical protein
MGRPTVDPSATAAGGSFKNQASGVGPTLRQSAMILSGRSYACACRHRADWREPDAYSFWIPPECSG